MKLLRLCRYQWDRTLAIVLIAAGFAGIIIAWILALQTIFAFEQIRLLIGGGIGGMALIAVGAASWLSADLRDEWRKLADLEDAVRSASPDPARETAPEAPVVSASTVDLGSRYVRGSALSTVDHR